MVGEEKKTGGKLLRCVFCVCGGIKALVSVNGMPAAEFGRSEVVKEMKVYEWGGGLLSLFVFLTRLDVRMLGRISGNTWQHQDIFKERKVDKGMIMDRTIGQEANL